MRRPKNAGKHKPRRSSVGVTVSIGAAERAAHERPEAVVKRADLLLYKAKRGGRNRTVLK